MLLAAAPAIAQPATQPATQPFEIPTSYLSLQTDPENCLSCHKFRGLSRIEKDTEELRLFFCSLDYYTQRQGPHSRLRCTACHEAEEVMVIPHQVRTPVDCARACHIVPSSGIEINFSHQRMMDSLEHSAHNSERLRKLRFNPPLLRPGQSMCLYCHDQPVFRDLGSIPRPIGDADLTTRCDLCHGEQMPADVTYYAHHVTNRLQPARPVRQLAQVCAVCHSDPKIIKDTGSHDTVASYLHSFHGKANLLGSTQTATCLDCHAASGGDVHRMLAKNNPDSSINEARLPTTCRTTQCHAGAPPGMSQAAVHLDLNPHARTWEFYVAAMFVALTAAVMTVFFILIILDLFNMIIRRRDPHHERMVRLARKLEEVPAARELLIRMSMHQRFQHWALAITFILLVATGMPIKFAESHWASWLITLFGGLTRARWIHRICGILLIVAFIYHLGYLLVKFIERVRTARRAGDREPIWRMLLNSPMMITPRDVRQFFELFAYLLFLRKERPRFGHFNFMQKFEYWAVFWGIPVMGLSGIVLWGAAAITEHISGEALNFAFIIHSDEAFLAFIYIAVVHIFSVILTPAIFPVSPGTVTGQVPPEELIEGHLGELEELARRFGINVEDEPLPRLGIGGFFRGLARRVYAAALMVACAAIGFISVRFLLLLLLTRQTAPVEIVEIPRRLDADLLVASAQAPGGHEADAETPPRGPLAHFHRIPEWFEPDPGNNCTTSGCHPPLPHGNRIEVRAFLNMHTTFLDCGVCHAAEAQGSDKAVWLQLPDRQPRPSTEPTPAVLRLADLLEKSGPDHPLTPHVVNNQVIPLLREAVRDSRGNAQLREWLLRVETAYPESEPWREAVEDIQKGIRAHVHGEYSAKIAMFHGDRPAGAMSAEQKAALDRFKAGERGKAIIDTLHKGLQPKGALCTPCHSPDPTLIDFKALGYSPARIESLQNSAVVRQMLSIEAGKPFHLPRIVEEKGDRQ